MAPLDHYPESTSNEGVAGLARRNASHVYTDRILQLHCSMNPDRPVLNESNVQPWCGNSARFSNDLMRRSGRFGSVHMGLSDDETSTVRSTFAEKFSMLDYYKTSGYYNFVQFNKALKRFENKETHGSQAAKNLQSEQPLMLGEALNVFKDFMDWFWNNSVLDLKSTWHHWEEEEEKLMSFMKVRNPLNTLCQPTYVHLPETLTSLFNATEYLATTLANVKSLLLFIRLSPGRSDEVLSKPNVAWVLAIRELGRVKERANERNADHTKKEKCLERPLMAEHLFGKEDAELDSCIIGSSQDELDCKTEAALGYMTLEGENGEVQHEAGAFLLVKDSMAL
ncbi:uncharacterized protein PAC_14072 [Phialocephala subalpina]|uniref:Uncharacterized protein n=1 Tax=Phialocephala subalpina TaxID=576137 RepID=A0A1L7XGK0_9HELO|nr:uncharacterized protein PAC_14072 [Phialocephala subalpina]